MREIKFRGKATQNDKWIYGGIVHYSNHYGFTVDKWFITDNEGDNDEVQRSTIGQFTGLYDKSGKEIYEGDIIKITVPYQTKVMTYIGKVIYCEDIGFYKIVGDSFDFSVGYYREKCREIIGNIYDNMNLLEVND